MREYFAQFGTITRLRLSRNKKTGRSKHYAFVEFESAEVAQIVADTMDNYLMFNHILKVKTVPSEQVHTELFKDANKRFKVIPRNKMLGRTLKNSKTEDQWKKTISKTEKARQRKADRLKSQGIEYELTSRPLKAPKPIENKKDDVALIEAATDSAEAIQASLAAADAENDATKTTVIETNGLDSAVVAETIVTKKEPKAKKSKAKKTKGETTVVTADVKMTGTGEETVQAAPSATETVAPKKKKGKKEKTAKSPVTKV
jgi:nucleolar protein 15